MAGPSYLHSLPGMFRQSTSTGGTTSSTGGLEKAFAAMSSEAKESNIKRQKKIEAIFDEIIARYQPGGSFGKSYLQQLGEQKTRDVGAGTQSLISSGMYGTTTTAGLPGKWEAEVGAPARLKLEDIQMERLSSAQLGKASFLERIEEPYPDYNALMQASAASGSSGGGGGGRTISGSVALPGNYNPLTDPTRHTPFTKDNVSGSVSEGGASISTPSTAPSGGGGTPRGVSLTPEQAAGFGAAAAQQAARDNPGTMSQYGNDAWVFEKGTMRHLRKNKQGGWMRVG